MTERGEPDSHASAALAAFDKSEDWEAKPLDWLDVGEWRGFEIVPKYPPRGPSYPQHGLVSPDAQEVLEGEDAMRLALEHHEDADRLARLALAFFRGGGMPLGEPSSSASAVEREHVRAPTIEGSALEYWYYRAGPRRVLFRDRLDLENLELDRVRLDQLE